MKEVGSLERLKSLLPTPDPEVKTLWKEHHKMILGTFAATGLLLGGLYRVGLMRPLMITFMGPITYGTLKVTFVIMRYLLWKSCSAMLNLIIGQFSYLQLLIISVSAAGLAGKAAVDKASGMLATQGERTKD